MVVPAAVGGANEAALTLSATCSTRHQWATLTKKKEFAHNASHKHHFKNAYVLIRTVRAKKRKHM